MKNLALALLTSSFVTVTAPLAEGVNSVSESDIAIERIGDGIFRIENVVVDQSERRYRVAGRVANLNKPLEYFAVSTGGSKAYESLLEVEASGSALKLASILIGLDDARSIKPRYQFDQREADGQAVSIWLSWDDAGRIQTLRAGEALLASGELFADEDWVYTGSREAPATGELFADLYGSLISFVHDPVALIDHRTGAGIGAYGSITGNAELLPPEGAPVTLSVVAINGTGGEEETTTEGD